MAKNQELLSWHLASRSLLLGITSLCFAAVTTLAQVPPFPKEIEVPMQALVDDDPKNDAAALRAIKQLKVDAVAPLTEVLKDEKRFDDKARMQAAIGLGELGAEAQSALGLLIQQATNSQKVLGIRFESIDSLVEIAPTAPETLQALADILESDDHPIVQQQVSERLSYSLGQITSADAATKIVERLKTLAKDQSLSWQVRLGAAQALAASGWDVPVGLSIVREMLDAPDDVTVQQTRWFMRLIGDRLSERQLPLPADRRDQAIEALAETIEALEQQANRPDDFEPSLTEIQAFLDSALNKLKSDQPSWQSFTNWLIVHPRSSAIAAILSCWVLLVTALFWLRPLSLLQLNYLLQRYTDIPLPSGLLGLKTSTLRLLLFDLPYHPRVLDAWVSKHLETARQEFQRHRTVQERTIHIPTPVVFDGQNLANLTAQDLQPIFAKRVMRCLIWGEGGSGKTSLACQLARWAMEEKPQARLCSHAMLPILLEQELNFSADKDKPVLLEAIRGQLRDLLDLPEPPGMDLLEPLLHKRRLLVIVDGLSEMSEATRQQIHPELPDFSINALVVTSRLEEPLGQVNRTTLKPMRVEGNRLSSFMEAYLTQRGKRELFTDEEFFAGCSQLSAIAGQQEMTVLLAKLYAEQMIAAKAKTSLEIVPHTIPALMLEYLNQLNQHITDRPLADRTVHHIAKLIAWECLKQTYSPSNALRDAVLLALDREDAEPCLDYLEYRLRIIQTIGAAQDRLRFELDPVAEYLAALHLLDEHADDPHWWHHFFEKLESSDSQPSHFATSQDFLHAIHDCCLNGNYRDEAVEYTIQRIKQCFELQEGTTDYQESSSGSA